MSDKPQMTGSDQAMSVGSSSSEALPTDAGGWADRIENYWILKDCERRDGKMPFDLLVDDIERIQQQASANAHRTLIGFHDAWVESQVASATGDPAFAKLKRRALIAAHKEVHALLDGQRTAEPASEAVSDVSSLTS